jgi:nicotinate phosphoribosyltransferase
MCYAHWKTHHHMDVSIFDLFFRKHPFAGEFTIFAGLEEVLRYLSHWSLSHEDIATLARKFPEMDAQFFEWLKGVDMTCVKVYAVPEGSVVFPRLPLVRVEGPLAVCQLLESALLVLVNYASLVATNAARHRVAVGPSKTLLEFGLRRAQGPDGAMSASRYSFMGGFDGTSNVKAALVFDISMRGTHAHSFVVSFMSLDEIREKTLLDISHSDAALHTQRDFVATVLMYRAELKRTNTHEGELAAFISYAQAFPSGFLGLLDTYDTLASGVWNFMCVALALHEVRISG